MTIASTSSNVRLPVMKPSRMTVMIKPVGALCNLDCTYCYYLPTKTIYDNHEHRMTLTTLEELFAGLLPQFDDEVTIAWQGGEPTLAGLDFFKKAIEFQEKYRKPSQKILHALQTNGTLLNDEWCEFLNKHHFLVGLSIDGPPELNDHYRVTNSGEGSSKQIFKGLKFLQKHKVEFNILCVLNDNNIEQPDVILDYLLSLGTRWLQFIPAIEWEKDDQGKNVIAPYSPSGKQYGQFLCRIFDRWFDHYRHKISVRIFDAVLNKLVLGQMPFCILAGECANQLTIEHDGAVFGCDHYIERRWQLSQVGEPNWVNNIRLDGSADVGLTIHGTGYQRYKPSDKSLPANDKTGNQTQVKTDEDDHTFDADWFNRVDEQRYGTFAARKQLLPEKCTTCRWKPFCYGGCPAHRPDGGEVPEPTHLCDGYIMFYEHTMDRFQWLAKFLREDKLPPEPENVSQSAKKKQHNKAVRQAKQVGQRIAQRFDDKNKPSNQ